MKIKKISLKAYKEEYSINKADMRNFLILLFLNILLSLSFINNIPNKLYFIVLSSIIVTWYNLSQRIKGYREIIYMKKYLKARTTLLSLPLLGSLLVMVLSLFKVL